jgi:hypothetical protein
MAKGSKKKSKRDSEKDKLVEENEEVHHHRKKPPVLAVLGELVSGIIVAVSFFTVLITLKITNVIEWSYWWVFSPLWLALFTLLILTQSRRVSSHMPTIARVVWLICLVSIVAFLTLVNFHLQQTFDFSFGFIFLPLWVLISASLLLGISGIVIALRTTDDDSKKRKYLLAGLGMLCFDIVFFPFFLLFALRLGEHYSFSWSVVFLPLWITDGFFFIGGFILILFTIGSRDSAIFSLSQLTMFIFVPPTAATFKALLVLALDGKLTVSYYLVAAPLLIMELLILTCGLHIRITKH